MRRGQNGGVQRDLKVNTAEKPARGHPTKLLLVSAQSVLLLLVVLSPCHVMGVGEDEETQEERILAKRLRDTIASPVVEN